MKKAKTLSVGGNQSNGNISQMENELMQKNTSQAKDAVISAIFKNNAPTERDPVFWGHMKELFQTWCEFSFGREWSQWGQLFFKKFSNCEILTKCELQSEQLACWA